MIVVERARARDAAEILEFLKIVGTQTDNLTFGAEGIGFSEQDEAEFLEQIESSCDDVIIIARDNDRIVATASLNRLPRRMSHRGELGVSVMKEYWNKGIASRCIEWIIGFARENSFEIIDLQVRSDNASAIHVYEKFGFCKIGTHPFFHKTNNEDTPYDFMFLNLQEK